MNHNRFPKEDHLPDWARRNNKVTKGDRVESVHTEENLYMQFYCISFMLVSSTPYTSIRLLILMHEVNIIKLRPEDEHFDARNISKTL